MKALTWFTALTCLIFTSLYVGSALATENLTVKVLPFIAIESGAAIPISVSVGSTASEVKVGFVSL